VAFVFNRQVEMHLPILTGNPKLFVESSNRTQRTHGIKSSWRVQSSHIGCERDRFRHERPVLIAVDLVNDRIPTSSKETISNDTISTPEIGVVAAQAAARTGEVGCLA
jgi:hypothetical protein